MEANIRYMGWASTVFKVLALVAFLVGLVGLALAVSVLLSGQILGSLLYAIQTIIATFVSAFIMYTASVVLTFLGRLGAQINYMYMMQERQNQVLREIHQGTKVGIHTEIAPR